MPTGQSRCTWPALRQTRALETLERAGVRRAVHWVLRPRWPVERALDHFEAAVAEWHGK